MMDIYNYARAFMAEHGNPCQWGPTNWPPAELIHKDIRDGNSYVCVNDAGKVIGTFFFIHGRDIEPTYCEITDGVWLDESPYGVVHRIAGDGAAICASIPMVTTQSCRILSESWALSTVARSM